jgi:hypothetical protein
MRTDPRSVPFNCDLRNLGIVHFTLLFRSLFLVDTKSNQSKKAKIKTKQIMIATTNQEHENTQARIIDERCQDWYYLSDDCREEDMMERMEEDRIFRDVREVDHTPIERSNNISCSRISLSPAWSEDSMEHLEPLKPTTDHTEIRFYWDGAPSNSVNKISDFDMDSGRIQKLNF